MLPVEIRTQEKEQESKLGCGAIHESIDKDPIIELCEKLAVMNLFKLSY